MSTVPQNSELKIPDRMQAKLDAFQKRVWIVKLAEGLLAAAFGLLVSYLVVFALDRFIDTSKSVRLGILLTGAIGLGVWFPLICHKWIWKSRKLEQVASMLRVKYPRLGDHLLGIIELVHNADEQKRSTDLCRAALHQVDEETKGRNFDDAVPYPKHRKWALIAGIPALVALLALLFVPAAGTNAFARWLMPWKNIERYTFTQIETLPKEMVVPIAENAFLKTNLLSESRWNPDGGSIYVNGNQITTGNTNGAYSFKLPPLKSAAKVDVVIGDVRKQISVIPKTRPELASMTAKIKLPDYLQRTKPLEKDIRGGSVTMVRGSSLSLHGAATRELVEASVDNSPLQVHGNSITTSPVSYKKSTALSFRWKDSHGLSAKTPLKIKVRVSGDAEPSLVCRKLEKQRVILEKDVLAFEVTAEDDFGIKTIGLEWKGSGTDEHETPVTGEKIVSAGDPNATEITATATFSPKREGIKPQAVQLRIFTEDYLPNRERVYSPAYTVYVLSEDDHAIWLSRQLNRWYKNTLESFEREKVLRNQNEALRNLSDAALEQHKNRRKIESQVAAEQSQARRLSALTKVGEKLALEAARNDQFDVGTLEKLSEMVQALKDISGKRMPSVANLLKESANAPKGAKPASGKPSSGEPGKSKPSDGKQKPGKSGEGKGKPGGGAKSVSDNPELPGGKRDAKNGSEGSKKDGDNKKDDEKKKESKTPSISMKESSMDKAKKQESKSSPPGQKKKGKFGLPTVALQGSAKGKKGGSCPAKKALDKAVDEQDELLAEFQKVAEELQKIISNLEGSTFVKRLKAMSRKQLKLAQDVNSTSVSGFGLAGQDVKQSIKDRAKLLAKREAGYMNHLNYIQDDLEAYVNRVPDGKFQEVLAEMKKEEAAKQLNTVSGKINFNQSGSAIAHAELLADTFDRWAEQLVGPPKPGGT